MIILRAIISWVAYWGWIYPLLFYQFAQFIRYPSFLSCLFLILAVLFIFYWSVAFVGMLRCNTRKFALDDYVAETECIYTQYTLEQCLPTHLVAKLYEVLPNTGISFTAENNISIYHVEPKHENAKWEPNAVAYATPIGGTDSIIFCPFNPTNPSGFEQFKLMHEVGHIILSNSIQRIVVFVGFWPLLISFVWSLGFLQVNNLNLIFLTVFAVLFFVQTLALWPRETALFRLKDEIRADAFASAFINEKVNKRLTSLLAKEKHSFLKDKDLSQEEHTLRMEFLARNLALNVRQQDNKLSFALNKADYLEGFGNSKLISKAHNGVQALMLFLMLLLGFSSSPPTWWTLLLYCSAFVCLQIFIQIKRREHRTLGKKLRTKIFVSSMPF